MVPRRGGRQGKEEHYSLLKMGSGKFNLSRRESVKRRKTKKVQLLISNVKKCHLLSSEDAGAHKTAREQQETYHYHHR